MEQQQKQGATVVGIGVHKRVRVLWSAAPLPQVRPSGTPLHRRHRRARQLGAIVPILMPSPASLRPCGQPSTAGCCRGVRSGRWRALRWRRHR